MVAGQEDQARLEGAEPVSAAAMDAALDVRALDAWMRDTVPAYRGPLRAERFSGGQSNPTYRLVAPSGQYVLRRKPPGQLVKGAHAVEREVRVITALAKTGFPVARVHGLCLDDAVIGSWFYVMDCVEGRIFWDARFGEVDRAERPAYFEAMNRTIAALHGIDPGAIGLGDFGRPGNYFARQIARWSDQYLNDAAAGRDANMDRLVEWLPRNIPASDEAAIVHGDFRCDNMIFHPTRPEILAVLDWELSTLGHPGADFAYHAMMYRMPPHIVAGLAGADLGALNIPSEQDYLAAYCRRTGRAAMPGYDFYIAFNFFRVAAIFHGIKGRVLRGTAASAQARERIGVLPELMALAWAQAERATAG
jgi:aminoglycoside phosphotransferase (APT) family kinase protein